MFVVLSCASVYLCLLGGGGGGVVGLLAPVCDVYVSLLLSHLYPGSFFFVALRPMSTAMVIAGRSVHLTTLFPGQA